MLMCHYKRLIQTESDGIFKYNTSIILFVIFNLSEPADPWLYKYLFEARDQPAEWLAKIQWLFSHLLIMFEECKL